MKTTVLFFLVYLSMISCKSSFQEMSQLKDPLITTQYKVINHGFIFFLIQKDNGKLIEKAYSYSIDTDAGKFICSLLHEKDVKFDKKYLSSMRFLTSDEFSDLQMKTWREKYYLIISPDFLKISNAEKIKTLDNYL